MTTDPDPRLLRLPASVHRRCRLQSGVGAEVVQHPVGLQGEQVRGIALLRIEERTVEEADIVQRERDRSRRGGARRSARGDDRGKGHQHLAPCQPACSIGRLGGALVNRHSSHNLSHPPSLASRLFAAKQLDQLSGGREQRSARPEEHGNLSGQDGTSNRDARHAGRGQRRGGVGKNRDPHSCGGHSEGGRHIGHLQRNRDRQPLSAQRAVE